jgi:hypothetical protein
MAKSRFRDEFRLTRQDRHDLAVVLSRPAACGFAVTNSDIAHLVEKFVLGRRRRMSKLDRVLVQAILQRDITIPARVKSQGDLGYTEKVSTFLSAFDRLNKKYLDLLARAA